MNVITATGQIWRQKYASPREGRFPVGHPQAVRICQGAAVIPLLSRNNKPEGQDGLQGQRYKRIERQI